ncbi:RNI-like superfamily protein [Rhynchospora pubera]|uniref:RNI-like superfamily protein n=1 Tax=Rhynchospora pubera TaxID=906938 RepID=A0AAV8FL43_9POAL|nr:RNI-like superfamily protein [Rhynchospora pubera]
MEGEGREAPSASGRNWAEMQSDVLMMIFFKIGLIEVLRAAGSVCRSWRKVAKDEPELWRRINMTNHGYVGNARLLKDLTRLAIDRSGGLLEEFSVQGFGDDDLLRYLCDRSSVLMKLCFISCYNFSAEAIAEIAKKQPLLEEIQMTLGSYCEKVTEIVGNGCPQLKSFKFNNKWYHNPHDDPDYDEDISVDEEALGIAKTMHQLRHLQLIGNRLTNEGLEAILDGCPHLEMLDIRRCYNVEMDADMQALCARLKTIRLPSDSVGDYEFEAEVFSDEELDDDVNYDIPGFHDDFDENFFAMHHAVFGYWPW